ncbi:MAG: LAGLIDADG family homing endonuclease [Gammaproteobacteria bacterium]|nr:LAGLIDADG family homing endonuclease [Gammaproteobacteria bacterium]
MTAKLHAIPNTVTEIPLQDASMDIWDTKYRLKTKEGEAIDANIDETYQRVARALADVEQGKKKQERYYSEFLWALRQGVIPAGRIISNAGAQEHKPATSTINCTVSGAIKDSMDDILGKVHEAGLTLKAGCVAPDTLVYTEKGYVTARLAVTEKHTHILSYDRDSLRFEMKSVLKHMTTVVSKDENIKITSNLGTLTTSIKHPVLVYRDEKLQYVRADHINETDALVHHQLPWQAEKQNSLKAWFSGAHLGDGSAYEKHMDYKHSRLSWQKKATAYGKRLIFKIRAAEREVVERYAQFFQQFCECKAQVVATTTSNNTPVWDFTVASFEASQASRFIDDQIGKKSHTLTVPGWIRQAPEKHFLPFLAGLMDTDGTVNTERGSASLACQSGSFVHEIQSLLALFGVHGAITHRKARSHEYNGHVIKDSGGYMIKISDSDFLLKLSEFMADSGKIQRIKEHRSQSGQYDQYIMTPALRRTLEAISTELTHTEKQYLGFYHGKHQQTKISRVYLDRWDKRFPELKSDIDFIRQLRAIKNIERYLDIDETFYDFTVDTHNNYLAGNNGLMVIHNCGIGYEFSTLRPKNAYVSGAGAYTSGPLSFMDIYDKMCFTVSSAGGRRGAQMATFDIGHPDVIDFIRAKREDGRLRQFNLSLLISTEFVEAVKNDGPWALSFPVTDKELKQDKLDLNNPEQIIWRDLPNKEGYIVNNDGLVGCRITRTLQARRLWDIIMSSTYDYAEPGFILIDKVNEMNNNWFCENIRATNPCVTADTRLHTQYGMVKIGDLYSSGSDLNVTVDNRALDAQPQSQVMDRRARGTSVRPAKPAFMTDSCAEIYRVKTRDGYEIKATAWHDFYTQRGKIKLRDLKKGDQLFIQSGKGQFGQQGDENLGQLLGLITGDGHFTNRGKNQQAAVVNLWNSDRSLAPTLVAYINQLIATVSEGTRQYQVSSVAIPQRNLVMIRSVILARVLDFYGFNKDTKLRVPEVIWQGNEKCAKAYLQALFQADGTVNISTKSQTCSIRLASSHPDLLKDIQALLSNFGIFCPIRKRRDAGMRQLPDGKGSHQSYYCKANYEIIIDGESRERFMDEIGFISYEKNHKYRDWVADKKLSKTQSFLSEISDIQLVGREAVFDTTQDDHNTVIFNGLVTGQCGEQPLPPYGSCLLGSINLTRFVNKPFSDEASFDWDTYRKTIRIFTRMLDNVVEINGLPLEQQREEITSKRRHGMGYLGLGSTCTMMGMKYGDDRSLQLTENVTKVLAVEGWKTGLKLAKEKGPAMIMEQMFTVTGEMLHKRPEMISDGFKAGDKIPGRILHAKYSRYMQQLAQEEPELVNDLAESGARFTHHSSIAPTGTISLSLANNASNGIEPSFAHHYSRNVIREGKKSKEKVDVYSFELLAYREMVNAKAMPYSEKPDEQLPDYFITADSITPTQHVDVQAAAQKWIDSSISKTANVPTDYPFEDFKHIYEYAYDKGLKGCTTFRFNPEAFQGVLVKEKDLENTTYQFTLENGDLVELKGNEEVEYDGETHTAANLFDALKEGYYGKF